MEAIVPLPYSRSVEEIIPLSYEINSKTIYSVFSSRYDALQALHGLNIYSSAYRFKNAQIMKVSDFWSKVHAVIRYNRKNSLQPLFEVCMTESDLTEKKISLLFDREIDNLEVVGGQDDVG